MRLLIINYEFPPLGGGAGNATAHLARELARQGIEVMVLTSAFRGLPGQEKVDGFTIRRVPVIRLHKDRCTPWEMLTFIISASVAAFRICLRWKPDTSIAFFGIPGGVVSLLLKVFYKIPYCLSLRGGDVPGFLSDKLYVYHRLTAPLIRLVWKHAGHVVTNSNRLKILAEHFSPKMEIPIIPNGVDTETYKPDISKRNRGKVRILTAGRLSEQKGIEFLLKALSLLKKKGLNGEYFLEIVGDGPLREPLEQLKQNLSLGSNVTFSGWVARKDMPERYQSADIFVLPSLDEGMPNVILEAMASGLPVIATDILKDEGLIKDGYNGMFVPSEDISMLSKKIFLLLKDKKPREDMGNRNIQLARDKYKWKDIALEYYRHLKSIRMDFDKAGSTSRLNSTLYSRWNVSKIFNIFLTKNT